MRPERTAMPLKAMAFVKKLASDRFPEAQLVLFPEFDHPTDCLLSRRLPVTRGKLVRWCGGSLHYREHIFFKRHAPCRGPRRQSRFKFWPEIQIDDHDDPLFLEFSGF